MFECQTIIEKIIIDRNKTVDNAILGEIQKIATDYGIDTHIVINEKAVVEALEKATPQKVRYSNSFPDSAECPRCGRFHYNSWGEGGDNLWESSYCLDCGQKLDWSDT